MKHKTLAIGILFLFLVSLFVPMTYSQTWTTDKESKFEKNDFVNNQISEESPLEYRRKNNTIKSPLVPAWPMKCHDTRHTSLSPYSTADNPYDELWRFEFDYPVDADPSIGEDGTIYIGGGDDNLPWYLYAIYPNGTLRWRYYTGGLIWHMCPAIAEDGTIYIGAWDNSLHAINPDGTEKWKFDTNCDIVSDPVIAEDGTIYFGTFEGPWTSPKVYAINPNGTEKWHYDMYDTILSDPAIGDDGTIYIGSCDNYLYALYPNGTLRWYYGTGDSIAGSPSIGEDGIIYFASLDDYLYALHPNGTMKWRTEIWVGSDTNPSIDLDGTIYICSASKLFAINPDNGDIDWEFDLGGDVMKSSSAICADGIIYTGIEIGDWDGGEIVAVNPDGTERWRKRIASSYVDSSPCIGNDGIIYIGSTSGLRSSLHAFGRGNLEADTNGPYQGIINVPVQFIGSASGGYHPYTYHWDFGDDETSDYQNPTHEYDNVGNYTVTLTVTDDNDSVADDTTWALIRESNDPPETPTIDGDIEGYFGEPYDYTFITTDLDGDNVWYYVEWGDGTNSGWLGPYSSGQEITVSHTWDEEDTYTIRAKAKDIFDAESDWGTLEVTMPVNQPIQYPLIQRLLELFPNAFPILRNLLRF